MDNNKAFYTEKDTTPRKVKKLPFIITGVIVLIIGYLVFAYLTNFWPFAGIRYSDAELFNQVFDKIKSIESASYEVVFSVESMDREPGAQPLSITFPELEELKPLYQRDQNRFRDLQKIQQELELFFASSKRYPDTLGEAGILLSDPSGYPYGYLPTENGKNYNLKITFETDDAIETLQKQAYETRIPVVEDKTAFFDINSITYYYFKGEPEVPSFIQLFENQNSLLAYVPGNFKTVLRVSGTTQKEDKKVVDARFQIGGEVNYEDFIVSADAEFLKKDKTYYFKLNKFPGIFFADLSKIKKKWIKIVPEDLSGSDFFDLDYFLRESGTQEISKTIMEQLKLFFSIDKEESLLMGVDRAEREVINEQRAYHYKLVLDKEKIAPFYERVSKEFEEKFEDEALIKFDKTTLMYLQSSGFGALVDYFNQNGSLDLFIEPKTGYPVRLSYTFRLVPEEDVRNLQDKQVVLSITLNLSDINKDIVVSPPKDFITFEEAYMLLTGLTREEYLFEKQTSSVSTIRAALRNYKNLAGEYPDSLEKLGMNTKELEQELGFTLSGPDYIKKRYEENPILATIPKDVFTEQPFTYIGSPDNYALSYKIELPPYEKGIRPSYGIYVSDYQYRIGEAYKMSLKYVEGINTADKDNFSKQAKLQSKIDSDYDALSDNFEEYLGTDKNNKDSDGDGYPDGEEISRSYDPLGPGTLEYKSRGYLF